MDLHYEQKPVFDWLLKQTDHPNDEVATPTCVGHASQVEQSAATNKSGKGWYGRMTEIRTLPSKLPKLAYDD
jgi:hypothetical protein